MKRTKTKKKLKVDAILTADWHLREDTPTCRTDDFFQAQWGAVQQVSSLQRKYKCPVLHAGDLFHHWKPSPRLLTYTMRYLPDAFFTIYGNHDLPQHSIKLAEKSGIATLEESGMLSVIETQDWIGEFHSASIDRKIMMAHMLVYTAKPYPGASGGMAAGVLRKYNEYDLILTGDNHQAFTIGEKGRLLVNPGNLTRQVANQIDFRPRVYLWNARTNKAKAKYLKVADGVISREHIERKEQRDERIEAFVERLNTGWESSLDFEENLRRLKAEKNISKDVMDIAYKALEEG